MRASTRFLEATELRNREEEDTKRDKYSGGMPGGGHHRADNTGHGGANDLQRNP